MRTAHDTPSLLLLTGAVLARHEAQITRHLGGTASAIKAMHVIESRDNGRRREGSNARTGGQALDDRVLRDEGRNALVSVGPQAPTGKEKNWIRTRPDRGWFTYVRFYSPTEAFFDKTWKPDDIVEMK
jgi:hypothetical protein